MIGDANVRSDTWPHKRFRCTVCKKTITDFKQIGWRMGAFFHVPCQKLKQAGERGLGEFAHADPLDWATCEHWCCAAMRRAATDEP